MSNHTISLEGLSEEAAATATSPEDDFFSSVSEEERKEMRRLLMSVFAEHLTGTQHQRVWMFHVQGLSIREIGRFKGSDFTSVRESIHRAEEKLRKFLKNTPPKRADFAAIGERTYFRAFQRTLKTEYPFAKTSVPMKCESTSYRVWYATTSAWGERDNLLKCRIATGMAMTVGMIMVLPS